MKKESLHSVIGQPMFGTIAQKPIHSDPVHSSEEQACLRFGGCIPLNITLRKFKILDKEPK